MFRFEIFMACNGIDPVLRNGTGQDRITILSCPVGISTKVDPVPSCPVGFRIILSCPVEIFQI